MSNRCNDSVLFWWLLLLAVDWNSGQGCRCESHEEWRYEPLLRDERAAAAPEAHRWRRPIAWTASITLVLIFALAWPRTPSTPFQQPPAEHLDTIAADSPPTELAEAISRDVETAAVIEALPDAITSVPSDLESLPSRALLQDAILPVVDAYRVELLLEPLAFDVGSSRDEVIAAQGRPPTYSIKNGRMLWWGSSKVVFTKDGYVTSWAQGTPPLNASSVISVNEK